MKYLLLFTLPLILACCATVQEIDKPLEPLKFEKEQIYTLDTSALTEPDAPNFIFLVKDLDGKLRVANKGEKPMYVAMLQEDLNKIDAMVAIKKGYKDIAVEQAHLVNIERNKVNALKEMLSIERQSRQAEQQLRLDIEKAYKAERKDHRLDNFVNRATMVVMVVGGVAIMAL